MVRKDELIEPKIKIKIDKNNAKTMANRINSLNYFTKKLIVKY